MLLVVPVLLNPPPHHCPLQLPYHLVHPFPPVLQHLHQSLRVLQLVSHPQLVLPSALQPHLVPVLLNPPPLVNLNLYLLVLADLVVKVPHHLPPSVLQHPSLQALVKALAHLLAHRNQRAKVHLLASLRLQVYRQVVVPLPRHQHQNPHPFLPPPVSLQAQVSLKVKVHRPHLVPVPLKVQALPNPPQKVNQLVLVNLRLVHNPLALL